MTFDGRVAFITGASGGIGAAVARMLHEAGASVGLASRRGDDLGLQRGLEVTCARTGSWRPDPPDDRNVLGPSGACR